MRTRPGLARAALRAQRQKTIAGTSLLWHSLLCCVAWAALTASGPASAQPGDDFGAYWYRGEAEITSYALEQARYGEVHRGHAVLIYVTEDLSRSKQVKLDNPGAAGSDRVPVLKLNFTKKFNTGLYPYSMMTSVFSPVGAGGDARALKVTTSSQEWCGHTFTQLNRSGSGYKVRQLSYFESEGDEMLTLDEATAEDELWTTIRLDPSRLPTGEVRLIPGTMYMRLRHRSWGVQRATATLEPADGGVMAYTLVYPDSGRTLTIRFNKAFPHEIEGWEEAYRSGWGPGAGDLTTRATRMQRMMSDYWTKNRVVDAALRQELSLE